MHTHTASALFSNFKARSASNAITGSRFQSRSVFSAARRAIDHFGRLDANQQMTFPRPCFQRWLTPNFHRQEFPIIRYGISSSAKKLVKVEAKRADWWKRGKEEWRRWGFRLVERRNRPWGVRTERWVQPYTLIVGSGVWFGLIAAIVRLILQ